VDLRYPHPASSDCFVFLSPKTANSPARAPFDAPPIRGPIGTLGVLKSLADHLTFTASRIICDPRPAFPFFCQMPGVAPVATVGVERCRRVGAGDLVLGGGEGGAFCGVFAFAAYRAFRGVVHREAFREFPSPAMEIMPDSRAVCLRYYLGELLSRVGDQT